MSLLSRLREERETRRKGGLYHVTQIKFCYNSNRIEGSRLSEEQTRFIFETNSINTGASESANIDDIIETVNHFTAFDYMLRVADEPLSEKSIKELHRILKTGTTDARKDWFRVGDYKTKPNIVGNAETTPPAKVQTAMKTLLAEYDNAAVSFESIIAFHHRFEAIHPFQDGNGRVGRLLLFKECLAHALTPFIIDEEHKLFYYRGLQEFEKTRGYLLDTCRSAADNYEALLRYFDC
jgi:DNA phosphorothioation-dependent restriction protein DptG